MEKKELKQEYDLRKEWGLPVEFINKDNNPFGFDVKGGVLEKQGGATFDPYKYTHESLGICLKNGTRVYENTEAIDIKYSKDYVTVETVYGYKVKGKLVIVSTGYNTKLFTNRSFGTTTTILNIATKPIKNLEDIYINFIVRDNEELYDYFRTTVDNRLIIGGEDISFQPDINNETLCLKKYDILEQRLKNLFPKLDIEIEYRYCGAFTASQDNLGFIGKDTKHPRLWYCLGYSANGILFFTLGGIMLSEMYLGKPNKYMNLFKINRFDK